MSRYCSREAGMRGREVVVLALVAVLMGAGYFRIVECQKLTSTYYATSCPAVDQIVRNSIGSSMNSSQIVGPSVLRLFAHDCFVGGCDGSILLEDSSPTSRVERDASDNLSLQQLAFDAVNQAKAAVEAHCPGVVSCADVLAMASEDVVSMMGGPSWTVLLGRRDGLNSSELSVAGHLPGADMDVGQMMRIFSSIGLSSQDLVSLSGAHTVGFAHCKEFESRLYNFNSTSNSSSLSSNSSDPSLSSSYLPTLQALCPRGNYSNSTVQALDPITAGAFDNAYYQDLQVGRGLLFSDQVLYVDNTTTNLVTTYANSQQRFFADFVTSMIAMGQVGVLTGAQGEIRLNCSVANGPNSVPRNSSTPPSNSTTPAPPNSTITPSPAPAPASATPIPVPPVVPASPPPAPVVLASPPPAPVVPASPPPAPIVTPSAPPAPVVPTSPPPAPIVTPSPPAAPVVPASPPPAPIVTPSAPPAPVVPTSPPPAPIVTPSPPAVPVVPASPPPAPIVTPSPPPTPIVARPPPASPPAAPVVPASPPPAPIVPASPPPAPVVTASPPPAPIVTPSPPPAPIVPASPPPAPVVTAFPPPAPIVTRSPPPAPIVPASPPPAPVVTAFPPPAPIVPASPPPAPVVTAPPPPVVRSVPSPPPPPSHVPAPPPPGGRRRRS